MKLNESILIEKVANGYIVSPKELTFTKNEEIFVYEKLESLFDFLNKHFNQEEKR